MPLNHIQGEKLEFMDDVWRIVPVSKYKELTRLTTEVEGMSTGKFKRKIRIEKPIWQAAFEYATACFIHQGAILGTQIDYDVICQEYPREGSVCFIFCAKILGKEYFVTAPFILSDSQLGDLITRNLWTVYNEATDKRISH